MGGNGPPRNLRAEMSGIRRRAAATACRRHVQPRWQAQPPNTGMAVTAGRGEGSFVAVVTGDVMPSSATRTTTNILYESPTDPAVLCIGRPQRHHHGRRGMSPRHACVGTVQEEGGCYEYNLVRHTQMLPSHVEIEKAGRGQSFYIFEWRA